MVNKIAKIVWFIDVLFLIILLINLLILFSSESEIDFTPFVLNLILLSLSGFLLYYSISVISKINQSLIFLLLGFISGPVLLLILFLLFSWNAVLIGGAISLIVTVFSGGVIFRKAKYQ